MELCALCALCVWWEWCFATKISDYRLIGDDFDSVLGASFLERRVEGLCATSKETSGELCAQCSWIHLEGI